MRKYECFFIVHPELSEEATAGVENKLKGIVAAEGGTVLSYESWGKKKLAYPVKKNMYGTYVLMEFAAGPGLVKELERNMRLDERVLKFITVKLEDKISLEELETSSGELEPAESETEEASESFDSEEVEEGEPETAVEAEETPADE